MPRPSVRRFRLSSVENFPNGGKRFLFEPAYDPPIEGDQGFAEAATSSGHYAITTQPAETAFWEVGNYYHFSVTPNE